MNQFFLANQMISCMTQVPDDELTQYPDEQNSIYNSRFNLLANAPY